MGQVKRNNRAIGYPAAANHHKHMINRRRSILIDGGSHSAAAHPPPSQGKRSKFPIHVPLNPIEFIPNSKPYRLSVLEIRLQPAIILLDSDFNPQVTNFLLAKFIPKNKPTTSVKGYFAPEYTPLRKASESCDVYGFGILLLELDSGKKPVEKLSLTAKRAITDWALSLACEGRFGEIVDQRVNGSYVEEELRRPSWLNLFDQVVGLRRGRR